MATSDAHDDQPVPPGPDGRRLLPVRTENGHQVIELPDDMRIDGDTVWISQPHENGDILLSARPATPPQTLGDLMNLIDAIHANAGEVTDDPPFMEHRATNAPADPTGVFDDLIER